MQAASFADRADAYAAAVVSGSIPASRLTRLAAERHQKDRARDQDKAFPWRWSADAAHHICAFVESLAHVEGALAGKPLRLDEWQVFVLASLNGWRDPQTNLRRFRRAYVEVPRKNGKSTLLAGVALYFFAVDGESGAKVYTAAASTHQARIVFDIANAMARQAVVEIGGVSRHLSDVLEIKIEDHKLRLHNDYSAVMQPIASQTKSKDGKNPHLGIADELHEHEKADVWNSLASAMGAREHPLLIAITTAGSNVAGICFEQHRYVEALLDGSMVNEAYFGLIYCADEGDDPGDFETWQKANPSLGSAKSRRYMEDEWAVALASAVAMGEFLRKHLDRWTSVGAAAFDLDALTRAKRPGMRLEHYSGCDAYIGVDLSLRDDLTSVAVVLDTGGETVVFASHFATQAQVDAPGNDHLAGWARNGLLNVCPGSRIDDGMVEDEILRLASVVNLLEVVLDPWRAASLMQRLSENEGMTVVEFRQSPMNMAIPVEHLQAVVEEERLITDGDPVLYWMAANTKVRKNGDFLRIEKADPTAKIDGIAAISTALGRMLAVEEVSIPTYLESSDLMVF